MKTTYADYELAVAADPGQQIVGSRVLDGVRTASIVAKTHDGQFRYMLTMFYATTGKYEDLSYYGYKRLSDARRVLSEL